MKLIYIIIWILFIISIGIGLWYLFGSSPTFEQAILVLILILLIANTVKLNVLENDFSNLKNSFCNLAKDFKSHIRK